MSDFVTIAEVGPRDGLQNEVQVLSTALRIELINRLVMRSGRASVTEMPSG
jgi:hydroxymethylglutaryl-CoA lyase